MLDRLPAHIALNAELVAALDELEFPIPKEAAIQAIGSRTVHADNETTVEVHVLLKGIAAATFEDAEHAAAEIGQKWSMLARNIEAIERHRALE